MWMMGCHDDFTMPDSFTGGRKLRPLIPRPTAPTPRIHAPDHFFALNHHLAMAEQNKRDQAASSVVVSSRWNPTPEQLRTLEELYRRGTRTPSADQIQHITAQLRRYGKIEGKNVFYWFQNHKARERQKRRRQMECDADQRKDNSSSSGGGSSTRVAGLEAEQNKNCTTTPPEEGNSIRAMAEVCTTTTRRDGWGQYEQRELQHQQQQIIMTRNATWRTMMQQLPCPLPHPPPSARVTPTPPTPTVPAKRLITSTTPAPDHHLNIFINTVDFDDYDQYQQLSHHDQDQDQTLELFPLSSENAAANQKLMSSPAIDASFPPNFQFFEFLPLKN